MHDFHTLMTEHDRLDRLAVQLLEIVAGEPDPVTALAVRADLSVTLDEHLGKEDGFLYDRLLGNAEEDCYPARVREFHSCFAALAADWKDYLQLWDNECVAADWTGFPAAGESDQRAPELPDRSERHERCGPGRGVGDGRPRPELAAARRGS